MISERGRLWGGVPGSWKNFQLFFSDQAKQEFLDLIKLTGAYAAES
jgi:hypothetical protein